MEDYHYVWLKDHPTRTEEWLKERLAEGFHVHHVNGNHDDNSPSNLILVEGIDHMRLHGLNVREVIIPKSGRGKRGPQRATNIRYMQKALEEALMAQNEMNSYLLQRRNSS